MTAFVARENSGLLCHDNDKQAADYLSHQPGLEELHLKLLLVSLCFLVVFALQFLFREYDNNRLLSWQWVMDKETFLLMFVLTIAGLVVAYKFCLLSLPQRRELYIVLVASFLTGIATWGAPETMIDSGRYFSHAKIISDQGLGYFFSQWGYGIDAWTDLPLASVIYGLVFSVFGETRMAAQLINTLLFSGSVFLTYKIGCQLWNARVGVSAAMLLLAIPFLHLQVSQLLVDIPAMFFTTCAVWASINAMSSKGTGSLLFASMCIVAAVLTKFSVWVILPVLLILPFTIPGVDRIAAFQRLVLLGIVTLVAMVFVFYVHHPIILKQIKLLLEYQVPAFGRWQESYLSTFLFHVHPFVSLTALAAIFFAIRRKDAGILIPAVALLILLSFGVFRARYLIIAFPMLALIAAYGVEQIKPVPVRRFVLAGTVLAAITTTLVANMNFMQSYSAVNLKNAGKFVNSLPQEQVVAIVVPQPKTTVNPDVMLPMFDYYLDKPLYHLQADGIQSLVTAEQLAISPVRFSWDVQLYGYPRVDVEKIGTGTVIVVLSGGDTQQIPATLRVLLSGFDASKHFTVTDKVFRFQSVATVFYQKNQSMGPT